MSFSETEKAPIPTHVSPPHYIPTVSVDQLAGDADSPSPICPRHAASKTPHLDAHFRQQATKARINALSAALSDAVSGQCCTRCALESAAQTVTAYGRDLHAAKKSGAWSRADKRAAKAEFRGLCKEMKRDLKMAWKNKQEA